MNSENITQKAIDYVEKKKEETLSLELVSREMSYSKYHFHRLFLKEMGLSIVDYIRRRRIITSTFTLTTTQVSILEVALLNGFKSVDTYIRNFKDYYGVTPQAYRHASLGPNKTTIKEHETMTPDQLVKNTSIEIREQALEVLDRMIDLSKIAHREGLLALEEAIKESDTPLLRKSIELLLKGTPPEKLRRILTTYITSSKLNEEEVLNRVLLIEGILLLQEGTYPWDLRAELSSYFGEEFIDSIESRYRKPKGLEKILAMEVIGADQDKLRKEISGLTPRQLQRLLRECDIIIIATFFMGLEEIMRSALLDSLPKGRKQLLPEVIDTLGSINRKHVNDASNEIGRIMQELRVSNDL